MGYPVTVEYRDSNSLGIARKTTKMRKIHINEQIWEYRIGRSNAIILSPDKIKHVVGLGHIQPGLRWEEDYSIKPAMVKSYIEKNLIHA
jgi:hypothetical protein